MTIREIVRRVKPDFVSVNNPVVEGGLTPETAMVDKVEIVFDPADGIHMYIDIWKGDFYDGTCL